MERSRFFHICLLALALACNTAQPPEPLPSEATRETSASADPAKAIPSLLPKRYQAGWFLPSIEQWNAYWREQYADSSSGDLRARTADLDGDGRIDHALLLCNADTANRDSSYALVVSFANGRDTLLDVSPWAKSEGGIGVGLTLHPPGPMGHLGGEEGEGLAEGSVVLEHPGVTLEYFEKASVTWFWSKGSFHKVWTGD